MLIIGLSCMFVSALEIVAEISNTFPDRKDARGYIVWYNIIVWNGLLHELVLPSWRRFNKIFPEVSYILM